MLWTPLKGFIDKKYKELYENIWPDAIEVNSASEAGEYTSQFWEEKKWITI